jgi:hypothetical protein
MRHILKGRSVLSVILGTHKPGIKKNWESKERRMKRKKKAV